ncbi:hypothetical protein [Streptomyces sp. 5-6(2022)]|nr:hypothetical protein [Streptomyces sp. 5-6(2022)]
MDSGGGGPTTAMHVTYYSVSGPRGDLLPVDRFTLTRSRRA